MPNTNPVIDNEILVEYIKMKAEREAIVNVLPIGSITKGQKGEELSNIGKMAQAGICAISEDGKSVMNAGLLKKAMKYANMFNLPVLSHCEDNTLVGGGVMNAGEMAERGGEELDRFRGSDCGKGYYSSKKYRPASYLPYQHLVAFS